MGVAERRKSRDQVQDGEEKRVELSGCSDVENGRHVEMKRFSYPYYLNLELT